MASGAAGRKLWRAASLFVPAMVLAGLLSAPRHYAGGIRLASLTPRAAAGQVRPALAPAASGRAGARPGGDAPPIEPGAVPGIVPPPAPGPPVPAFHCAGNPPRQIQDTQAPPCVAYWAGNNGGATAAGVTATAVRVLASGGPYSDGPRVLADLQDFFNRHFELYGRKVEIIAPQAPTGDCAAVAAAADLYDKEFQPFATTALDSDSVDCYRAEMAHDHVVTAGTDLWMPSHVVAAYAPYLWSYSMAGEAQMVAIGRFVCGQLAGSAARWSPDPLMASEKRRFGLILQSTPTPDPPRSTALVKALAGCRVSLAATATYLDSQTGLEQSEAAAIAFDDNAISAMKAAGVTTVICLCDAASPGGGPGAESAIPLAADAQGYSPEWLLARGNGNDSTVDTSWPDPLQRMGLMGITFEPDQVPYVDTTLAAALSEVDPGFQPSGGGAEIAYYQRLYWQLLLIVSGLQMAGPDLMPAQFQQGLQTAGFPNPPSRQQEGAVGFAGASHSMTLDAAVAWWSNTAQNPAPDGGPGAWCYADGGRRLSPAALSRAALVLFAGACYTTPPGS